MERTQRGLEEQRVAVSAAQEEERVQGLRDREDEVEVLDRQQAAALGRYPAGLLQALALGTVTVAAGVIEGLLAAAAVTDLHVATQSGCSALEDVSDHPAAVRSQLLQGRSVSPEDLRQLRRAALPGRQRRYLVEECFKASSGLRVWRK